MRFQTLCRGLLASLFVLAGLAPPVTAQPAGQDPTTRLTGASLTLEEPWVVYYTVAGSACSGSVLSPHWILTAAHCVHDKPSTVNRIVVSFADTLGGRQPVYTGPARFHVHPGFSPIPGTDWDPSDDIALIELLRIAGTAPPVPPNGIDLALTGRARLYVPFTEPVWADPDANRLFSIIGWGKGDVNGNGECTDGTGAKKRFGTYFEMHATSPGARKLTTGFGLTHACGGDSGAPWLIARGGVRMAFAVHSGRTPDLVITNAKMHGTTIRPKYGWLYEASVSARPQAFLNCSAAGTAGGLIYATCEEKAKPEPEPVVTGCGTGQICCEPGIAGELCALCLPQGTSCP